MFKEGKEAYNQQCMILLKPKHFCLRAINMKPLFLDQICVTSYSNIFVLDIKHQFNKNYNKWNLVDN